MPCTYKGDPCDEQGWSVPRSGITIGNVSYGESGCILTGFDLTVDYPIHTTCPQNKGIPYEPDPRNVVVKLMSIEDPNFNPDNFGTAGDALDSIYAGMTEVARWRMRPVGGLGPPKPQYQFTPVGTVSQTLDPTKKYSLEVELYEIENVLLTGRGRHVLAPCQVGSLPCAPPQYFQDMVGLRVEVVDAQNCCDSESMPSCSGEPQQVKTSRIFGGDKDCYYQFCVTVEGSVERHSAPYDFVCVREPSSADCVDNADPPTCESDVFFHGSYESLGCDMATKTVQKIIVLKGDTAELAYNTSDSLHHVGGYAEIKNVEYLGASRKEEDLPNNCQPEVPPQPCPRQCNSQSDCINGADDDGPCTCEPCENDTRCSLCETKVRCDGEGKRIDPNDPCGCVPCKPCPPGKTLNTSTPDPCDCRACPTCPEGTTPSNDPNNPCACAPCGTQYCPPGTLPGPNCNCEPCPNECGTGEARKKDSCECECIRPPCDGGGCNNELPEGCSCAPESGGGSGSASAMETFSGSGSVDSCGSNSDCGARKRCHNGVCVCYSDAGSCTTEGKVWLDYPDCLCHCPNPPCPCQEPPQTCAVRYPNRPNWHGRDQSPPCTCWCDDPPCGEDPPPPWPCETPDCTQDPGPCECPCQNGCPTGGGCTCKGDSNDCPPHAPDLKPYPDCQCYCANPPCHCELTCEPGETKDDNTCTCVPCNVDSSECEYGVDVNCDCLPCPPGHPDCDPCPPIPFPAPPCGVPNIINGCLVFTAPGDCPPGTSRPPGQCACLPNNCQEQPCERGAWDPVDCRCECNLKCERPEKVNANCTACECGRKPDSCGEKKVLHDCKCHCKGNTPPNFAARTECQERDGGWEWSNSKCECECNLTCPNNRVVDKTTCKCVCDPNKRNNCTAPKEWNEENCTCSDCQDPGCTEQAPDWHPYPECNCQCDFPPCPRPTDTDTPPSAASLEAAASAADFAQLKGFEQLGSVIIVDKTPSAEEAIKGEPLAAPLNLEIKMVRPQYRPPMPAPLFIQEKKSLMGRILNTHEPTSRSIEVLITDEILKAPQLYRRVGANKWAPLPGKYAESILNSPVYHYGFYQVFSPIPNLPFSFGEVYVFPNPTKGGDVPTIHVEVGQATQVTARVYDISGDLVYEARIDENPVLIAGKPSYEHAMNPSLFKSGVYHGVVTAEKSGKETIRKKFRFSVVK